ncbi:MAG: class I SAM-dependent methyltransferase [Candidatus Heimdallarchaeota archaeon]|nr:MAG: class I SAM-dependent methyltransferase [Candidatus Heimdallarchaeota archaeon]
MDIVEQLIPKGAKRVLDVGCGDINVGGHLYCHNRLKRRYRNVLGIDLNPGQQENVIQASAMKIPFADQSIEFVVSFDVIEHIKDYSSVIKDMLRVASERVIIIVPTTKNRSIRPIFNFLRRMLHGVNNFIFQGHYYEFYPFEICKFKRRIYSCKFITINYPILGASIFHRKGLITAGIYVFDRLE